jgi:two-component system LytT family response regulator
MRILVVDDEALALNRVKRILESLNRKDIEVITTSDPKVALQEVRDGEVEVAFLDINMPQNGIELAGDILDIDSDIAIIFQTAYDEYALDAYRVGGIDYILKPTDKVSIESALKRAEKFRGEERAKSSKDKKFLTKSYGKLAIVDATDILYIKADLSEIIIRTADGESYMQKTISQIEESLKAYNFFRIHRSYLVNLDKVKEFTTVEQSKIEINFEEIDEVITSSRDRSKLLREHLQKIYDS